MRVIKFFISLCIIFFLAVCLIVTRPDRSDFAEWYVEKNQTSFGIIDGARKAFVEARTESENYLVFAVFELEDDRYVGVLGKHFFGRNSLEMAEKTLDTVIEEFNRFLDEHKKSE